MKKICVVTGTRAEFGLLRNLLDKIRQSDFLNLQLIVTGSHLSPAHGLTRQEIVAAGFEINDELDILLSSETETSIAKSVGLCVAGLADIFQRTRPDLVVVLGDRFEMLAVATTATIFSIPIAHIHGGELSEGSIDDAIRHSITKMAHIHFVAAEEYRKRVIQLGESPDRVFCVGALGIDSIHREPGVDKLTLEKELGFKLLERNLIVTFHPPTRQTDQLDFQISELLKALGSLQDTLVLFTLPNADVGGQLIANKIYEFCKTHANSYAFRSLGQRLFLSCLRIFDGIVGNSSSGIIEAPYLKIGTLNIGARQDGRAKASSIIDCDVDFTGILRGLDRLFSREFRQQLQSTQSLFGDGQASDRICAILESTPISGSAVKRFFDLSFDIYHT